MKKIVNKKTTEKKKTVEKAKVVKKAVKEVKTKVKAEPKADLDGKMTAYLYNKETEQLERKTQAQLHKLVGLEPDEWELLRKNIKKGKKIGNTQYNIYKNKEKNVMIMYGVNLQEDNANAILLGLKARAEQKKNGILGKTGIKTPISDRENLKEANKELKQRVLCELANILDNYGGNVKEAEDELNREMDEIFIPEYLKINKGKTQDQAEKEVEKIINEFINGKGGSETHTYHCRAEGINWDVDSDDELENLPSMATIDIEAENEDEVREVIADKLTDEYGFCINHIDKVIINEKGKVVSKVDNKLTSAQKVADKLSKYETNSLYIELIADRKLENIKLKEIEDKVFNFLNKVAPEVEAKFVVKGKEEDKCLMAVLFNDKSKMAVKLLYNEQAVALCFDEYNIGDGWKKVIDPKTQMSKFKKQIPELREYKGFTIDCYKTYPNKISVQINGDDEIFGSTEEAERRIDKLTSDEERVEAIKIWQSGKACREGYKRFELNLSTNDTKMNWEEFEKNFGLIYKGKGKFYGIHIINYIKTDGYVSVYGYIDNGEDLERTIDKVRCNVYDIEVTIFEDDGKKETNREKGIEDEFTKKVEQRKEQVRSKYGMSDLIYAEDIGYDEVGTEATHQLEDEGYNITYDD